MKDYDFILKELIDLELNISELYTIFYSEIKEDSSFWWELLNEEKTHASLLISSRSFMDIIGENFFVNIKPEIVVKENKKICDLINKYKKSPPTRVEALEAAIMLEEAAGEAHYQNLMTKDSGNRIEKVLKELNNNDINHAKRIKNHLDKIINI